MEGAVLDCPPRVSWQPGGDFVEFGPVEIALHLDVIVGLDVDPEVVVDAQRPGQAQCCLGGDRALAADDLADAGLGESSCMGESVLRDAQWLQELGEQDLSRCDRVVCP